MCRHGRGIYCRKGFIRCAVNADIKKKNRNSSAAPTLMFICDSVSEHAECPIRLSSSCSQEAAGFVAFALCFL